MWGHDRELGNEETLKAIADRAKITNGNESDDDEVELLAWNEEDDDDHEGNNIHTYLQQSTISVTRYIHTLIDACFNSFIDEAMIIDQFAKVYEATLPPEVICIDDKPDVPSHRSVSNDRSVISVNDNDEGDSEDFHPGDDDNNSEDFYHPDDDYEGNSEDVHDDDEKLLTMEAKIESSSLFTTSFTF